MSSAFKIASVLAALAVTVTVALGLELYAHLSVGVLDDSVRSATIDVMHARIYGSSPHPQASHAPATQTITARIQTLPSPAATAQALQPDARPRIIAMSISSSVAHEGDVISGVVQTSSNVASVEARIAGYSSGLTKIGDGRFALSYRVPKLPAILHRTYSIEVIARNARGDAVTGSVPITIQ